MQLLDLAESSRKSNGRGGCMLALWIAFVACVSTPLVAIDLEVPARPVTPARGVLLAIWQKEMLSGKREEAAEDYEHVYQRGTIPRDLLRSNGPRESGSARSVGSVTRIRAAYRAARSFEAMGNQARAVLAYEWLLEAFEDFRARVHDPSTPGREAFASLRVLRDRVRVRIAVFKPARSDSTFAAQSIRDVLEQFAKLSSRDALLAERMRQELSERRRRLTAGRDLIRELESGGAELRFPTGLESLAARGGSIESVLSGICSSHWSEDEVSELVRSVRAWNVLHALRSAADRDEKQARQFATRAAWLTRDDAVPEKILRTLAFVGASSEPSFWRAQQEAFFRERVADRRRRVRFLLLQGDGFERGDRALRKILQAFRVLSFGSADERLDLGLETFGETARLRARERAGATRSADTLKVLDGLEESVRHVLRLSRELAHVVTEEFLLQSVPEREDRAVVSIPGAGGRLTARVLQLEGEIRQRAEDAARERKRLRAEIAVHKHVLLRRWFPELLAHVSEVVLPEIAEPALATPSTKD